MSVFTEPHWLFCAMSSLDWINDTAWKYFCRKCCCQQGSKLCQNFIKCSERVFISREWSASCFLKPDGWKHGVPVWKQLVRAEGWKQTGMWLCRKTVRTCPNVLSYSGGTSECEVAEDHIIISLFVCAAREELFWWQSCWWSVHDIKNRFLHRFPLCFFFNFLFTSAHFSFTELCALLYACLIFLLPLNQNYSVENKVWLSGKLLGWILV